MSLRTLTTPDGTHNGTMEPYVDPRLTPEERPVEIPRSMDAVRASRDDVPSDTENPMYPVHFGLSI